MSRKSSLRWMWMSSLACVGFAGSAMAQTASTDTYRPDANNLPISARTRFFGAAGNPDLVNTAEHEVFHATGFTTGYTLFTNHLVTEVIPQPNPGDRDFYSNGNRNTGTLRAILLPTGSNHLDRRLTVNGTDQADDIMRPDQVRNQRLTAFDAAPLNDAFGWNGRNLAIGVTFDNSFPNVAALRTNVTDARDAEQTLFNSNGSGHAFAWTVLDVPAPPRRGDRQELRTDAPYQSLTNDSVTYTSGGTTVTLTNVSLQFGSTPSVAGAGETDFLVPAVLTADAFINSPSGTSIGSITLSGLTGMKVFDAAPVADIDDDDNSLLSSNATALSSINLTGTFQGSNGIVSVSLIDDPSNPTTGETNVFDGGAGGGFKIDSFFDVFTELSLDSGPLIPSSTEIYLGYVPEPTSIGLLGAAAIAICSKRRRRA